MIKPGQVEQAKKQKQKRKLLLMSAVIAVEKVKTVKNRLRFENVTRKPQKHNFEEFISRYSQKIKSIAVDNL